LPDSTGDLYQVSVWSFSILALKGVLVKVLSLPLLERNNLLPMRQLFLLWGTASPLQLTVLIWGGPVQWGSLLLSSGFGPLSCHKDVYRSVLSFLKSKVMDSGGKKAQKAKRVRKGKMELAQSGTGVLLQSLDPGMTEKTPTWIRLCLCNSTEGRSWIKMSQYAQ
jgi:hypothetical protein